MKLTYPLFLISVTAWWFGTVLIDFFIVPSVFRIIENFFNAGHLGIHVFSAFNKIELVLASLLVIVCLQTRKKILIFSSLILFILIMTYFSYLTPKITELTVLWEKSENIILNGRDYQQEHQYFHKIYVGLDSVKLLILSALLGFGLFKRERFP